MSAGTSEPASPRSADPELREDRLLGGRVRLLQPLSGYRAATDPVLLAAAVPATPGQSVLELGIGAGAATLCLAARVGGLSLAGLEIEPLYLGLAARNAALNGVEISLVEGDIAAPPPELRARSFDHVILNPPYHPSASPPSPVAVRDRAHREGGAGIDDWIGAALARARPRGRIALIHRAERLPEILAALTDRAGAIEVLPLAAREGRDAKRVIVRARKGVRTPSRLLAPLVLHEGQAHLADQDDFTRRARAILRDARPIDFEETSR
ncbi:methyltransferase [Limibaculum sp. M0105]|uniref:Methyltransferase n=1 Tax=Thermohalobaculum xanthum TaxID=2753746 RepID=A0A8J7SGC9_9RHOB|nr:methyltransferase [Thermohalobaculum xanthum]MBK0400092.1 methyltransferase [Thermohalobaculum xanthum]